MPKGVTYELGDGVARIGLDDGKVNAMSAAMLGEIAAPWTVPRRKRRSWCCARRGRASFPQAST